VRLLVTGGAGFIGSNFVRRQLSGLSDLDIESIIVIDALTYAGNIANLESVISDTRLKFVHKDINDRITIDKYFHQIDVVVHFAAESHVDRSILNPSDFLITNVLGTDSILELSLKNFVKMVIIVSTDEVYGSISSGSWPETDPLGPNSPYAASKASAELLAKSYSRTFDMDIRITRCGNNYGPFQFIEKLIPLSITNLILGKKIQLYGNGKNMREWIHVDDHCEGIENVISKGQPNEIYNIGSGEELSNYEIASQLLKEFNVGTDCIAYVQDRKGHDFRYSMNCEKIQELCGFTPKRRLQSELPKLISWYKLNENWWKPNA
jgi:dTDP-glucose 4,6-dehydratase